MKRIALSALMVLFAGRMRAAVLDEKPAGSFPGTVRLEILDRDGISIPREALQKTIALAFQSGKSPGSTETVTYELRNLTDNTQFLQIRCGVSFVPDQTTAYDGLNRFDVKPFEGEILPTSEMYRIPLLAAWNARSGIGIAAGAKDHHSRVLPLLRKNTDNSVTLSSVVFAALLGKNFVYRGTFVLIPFDPKYQERDCLARYYLCYPDLFFRRKDIDPRLYGIQVQYGSWQSSDAEACRVGGGEWEWCIFPTRRTGEIDDSHWDYAPPRPFTTNESASYTVRETGVRVIRTANMSREEWLQIQDYKLQNAKYCNVANGFYNCPNWVEETLAKQYPDALVTDHSTEDIWRFCYGQQQDAAQAICAFPETTWGAEVRRMMSVVAARPSPISAFAFDAPTSGQRYRGPALEKMQNVAWDEFGPYVVNGVSNAKLYDYVRTLKNNGQPLGVANNGHLFTNYHECFFTDSTIIEAPPWRDAPPWPQATRYAMGEKAIAWHCNLGLDTIVKVDDVTPEDCKDAFRGLADYTAHHSFRWGVTYTAYLSYGSAYLQRLIPAMRDCFKAAWKVIPGAISDNPAVSVARYGTGLNSYLALNAYSREDQAATLELFPSELWSTIAADSTGCVLPLIYADYYGNPVTHFISGRSERLNVAVKGRKVLILESIASLNEGAGGEITVEEGKTFERILVTLRLKGGAGTIEFPAQRKSYRIDGPSRLELAGKDTITVTYTNSMAGTTVAQIGKFKFLNRDLKPEFAVVCSGDDESRYLSARLDSFFRNYAKFTRDLATLPEVGFNLSVSLDETLPAHTILLVQGDARKLLSPSMLSQQACVSGLPEQGLIVLGGASFAETEVALAEFLNILNRWVYPEYIGKRWEKGIRSKSFDLLPTEKALFRCTF